MADLVLGGGYLGRRVAELWRSEGRGPVYVSTRTASRAMELARAGFEPLLLNVVAGELPSLPAARRVLWSVGYDPRSGQTRQQVYVQGLARVLGALPNDTGRLVFISSTGVFGDAGGDWVDEDSVCRPLRDSPRALFAAEGVLRAHAMGTRSIILRMAGLYGPGRLLRADELARGEPIAMAAGSFLNLIHVDDAARVVAAVAERAVVPSLYVVSDGVPVERREYFRFVAECLGLPPPTFVEPPPDAGAGRHDGSSKRVCNARMVELGVQLRYPSYREGLRAVLGGQVNPKSEYRNSKEIRNPKPQ